MPPFGPVNRKDLIRHLRQFGFEGPYSGGKHQFMVRGETTHTSPLTSPGRHRQRTFGENPAPSGDQQGRVGTVIETRVNSTTRA